MTPTPSPDPARYVSPVCRDGSHQACANFRGTCRCTCHAAAVEGTERPGGWVDGIGWVARLGDVADDDLIRHGEPTSDPARDARRWYTPTVLVEVSRWADGSTPQPPVPPQGTERPDTADLRYMAQVAKGRVNNRVDWAEALNAAADWIDAQPPVPPTPASQPDDELRAEISVLVLALWNACTDGWADGDSAMASYITAAQEALSEGAPDAATAPSAPVERPAPGQFEDPASGSLI